MRHALYRLSCRNGQDSTKLSCTQVAFFFSLWPVELIVSVRPSIDGREAHVNYEVSIVIIILIFQKQANRNFTKEMYPG
jgi:hypothetical protein